MRRCCLLLAVALWLGVLAGCGDGAEPSPGETGPTLSGPAATAVGPSTSAAPSEWYAQTADEDCPSNYPVGLLIWTDVQVELEYLRDVLACTNPAHTLTYLKNTGEVVWKPRLTSPWSADVQYFHDSPKARSYRSAVAGRYAHALLTPEQVLVVGADPRVVAWDLDLPLSLSYQVHDTLVSELKRYGEGAVVAALDTRSRRGAALAGCTISGYNIATEAPDLAEKPPREWVMLGISGSAGVSTCVSSWQEADVAEAQAGRRLTLTAEELPGLRTSQAVVLERADRYLTRATYAEKIIGIALKLR